MNWKEAKKAAKSVFAKSKPTRASSFAATNTNQTVLVNCYDEDVVLVLYGKKDLQRLRMVIDIVLGETI